MRLCSTMEAVGSLTLRSDWSTEQVPGQPNLSSKGNQQKQKTDTDVIEQGDLFLLQETADLGNFRHMVLTLEPRIQEKVCGASFCD